MYTRIQLVYSYVQVVSLIIQLVYLFAQVISSHTVGSGSMFILLVFSFTLPIKQNFIVIE